MKTIVLGIAFAISSIVTENAQAVQLMDYHTSVGMLDYCEEDFKNRPKPKVRSRVRTRRSRRGLESQVADPDIDEDLWSEILED